MNIKCNYPYYQYIKSYYYCVHASMCSSIFLSIHPKNKYTAILTSHIDYLRLIPIRPRLAAAGMGPWDSADQMVMQRQWFQSPPRLSGRKTLQEEDFDNGHERPTSMPRQDEWTQTWENRRLHGFFWSCSLSNCKYSRKDMRFLRSSSRYGSIEDMFATTNHFHGLTTSWLIN